MRLIKLWFSLHRSKDLVTYRSRSTLIRLLSTVVPYHTGIVRYMVLYRYGAVPCRAVPVRYRTVRYHTCRPAPYGTDYGRTGTVPYGTGTQAPHGRTVPYGTVRYRIKVQ